VRFRARPTAGTRGRGTRGQAAAAGPAVGPVVPGPGQPGDDRRVAAPDDQGEPGGQLADHVRGGDVEVARVVLPVDLPARLPAQRAGGLQGGGVGDAGQEHLHRAGVPDNLAAVVLPPSRQLGLAMHNRDDLDALAARIRQPLRQRDRADLGDLIQAHQQRRVQPSRLRRLPHQRRDVVDLGGHRGEQRGDRRVLPDRLRDHVDRPALTEERGDVEAVAGGGQHAGGQGGVGHERQRPRHHHPHRRGGLLGLGAELRQGQGPLPCPVLGQDLLGDVGIGTGDPRGDGAHVVAGQGGGVEVPTQVVTGLGRPEAAVLDAFSGDRERERVGPADRGGRVLAPGHRRPGEGGRDGADVLRVEHVHRAALGANRRGEAEDVGLGGGRDDRAGIAEDHVGQERGLERPRRGHHQHVLFQWDPQAVPPVRPAEEYRVLSRRQRPRPQRKGAADAAGAAQAG
jgi:hypothetical protein